MAQAAGFVVLTNGERRAGWQAAKQVRLSPAAEMQRAEIEARLAASDIAPERPLLELPPVQVEITRNYDGLEDAPLPIGFAVAEALAPIQSTAWRVNRFMLDTLRALAPTGETAALKQASRYVDEPEFFYRCNFDWRGRLYQRGGRLQYTSGTDAARALLEFARGERLTSDGRIFLGVHVATCRGVRGSFTDRMVWTDRNAQRIAESVADPLGSRWWRKAKQPYRFLAACHAWVNQAAPVHLPVTADATASGFQHYAWLLRNEQLGQRVNLEPGDIG
jgi:DNA-directed RNA polymerase